MNRILRLAGLAGDITDEELAEAQAMADEQLAYNHPLKMKTVADQHRLGEHNARVIAKVRELREAIRAGAELGKKHSSKDSEK